LPFLKYNVKGQGKFTNRANLQAAIGLFAGFERDNGNDEQVSRRLIPRTGQPVPRPGRHAPQATRPPGPVATPSQATRQGWPYYTRLLSRRHEPPV